MNARDNTPLRTLIAAHLDESGESTALAIAKAVGKADIPSVVVKELNSMRTDGQVECEQRKKDMLYWLAVPIEQVSGSENNVTSVGNLLPHGVREGTRAAQIYRTLPEFGGEPITAREIAMATGCAKGLIAPVLTAMDKAGQIMRIPAGAEGGGLYGYTRLLPAGGGSESGETHAPAAVKDSLTAAPDVIPPPQYEPDEVAFAAPADPAEQLAAVNARLADAEQRAVLATEMLAERGRTVETLQDMIRTASETLAPHVPGTLDTSDMDLQEIADRVVAGVADLTARLNNQDDELLKQVAVIVDLRNQLGKERAAHHALQESPTLESIDPAGYLVRAPKRKPRTLQAEDKAREAALGAIRAGAPRAEVFALVPVGHARRNAEWKPA